MAMFTAYVKALPAIYYAFISARKKIKSSSFILQPFFKEYFSLKRRHKG
jgi:hypothetical protein